MYFFGFLISLFLVTLFFSINGTGMARIPSRLECYQKLLETRWRYRSDYSIILWKLFNRHCNSLYLKSLIVQI